MEEVREKHMSINKRIFMPPILSHLAGIIILYTMSLGDTIILPHPHL